MLCCVKTGVFVGVLLYLCFCFSPFRSLNKDAVFGETDVQLPYNDSNRGGVWNTISASTGKDIRRLPQIPKPADVIFS